MYDKNCNKACYCNAKRNDITHTGCGFDEEIFDFVLETTGNTPCFWSTTANDKSNREKIFVHDFTHSLDLSCEQLMKKVMSRKTFYHKFMRLVKDTKVLYREGVNDV